MASGFGYRIDPIYKTRKFHAGMDFSAKTRTPIYPQVMVKFLKSVKVNVAMGIMLLLTMAMDIKLYTHICQKLQLKETKR